MERLERTLLSLFVGIFLTHSTCFSQSVVKDLATEETAQGSDELITEKIQRISHSKKIFILSNESQKLGMGDFISLLRNEELVVRALVARTGNNFLAIKILKIYSMKLWNTLSPHLEVQILQGDDTYYTNLKAQAAQKEPDKDKDLDDASSLVTEEDLFNATGKDDDIEQEEKGNREIKPDNILGASFGQISAIDTDESTTRFAHWGAHWAYQVADNVWGEFFYGQSLLKAFPSEDLDTTLTNLAGRVKYTISAPMYMYLQPYVGFQIRKASSPNAGVQKEDDTIDQAVLDQELRLVDQLEKNSVIFGVSVLKRLVPGWFIKADLGTDIINVGFSIEF